MDKIYKVALIFSCPGEIQETVYGYYSTLEKAEARKSFIIKTKKENEKDLYIDEIIIDKDIEE
jgi:hypothetical protein